MNEFVSRLGFGIGWRPELALWVERREDLGFVEVVAECLDLAEPLPKPLERMLDRGVAVVPHGISLSLGGAEPLDAERLDHLARLADRLNAPLVSEHVAFVRAGGVEAGHLLPLPRTAEALDVLVENIRATQAALPVPLAMENISTLIEWPESEMDEPEFLNEMVQRTGVSLLLDVANIFANAANHGWDTAEYLKRLPLDRIAYVHLGGGTFRKGVYHDTHAHTVPLEVYNLLEQLAARTSLPGVMLERDDNFPGDDELTREFDAMISAKVRGDKVRGLAHVG